MIAVDEISHEYIYHGGCLLTRLGTKEPTMAGTLTIRTTQNHGKVTDLRYSTIWSAWLDGEMVGKGYCYKPEQAEQQALDLVTPEQVTNIKSIPAGVGRGSARGWYRVCRLVGLL